MAFKSEKNDVKKDALMTRRNWLMVVPLAAGTLFALWTAVQTDRQLRRELLAKVNFVSRAIDIDHALSLTGTVTDLTSPDYRRLMEQLTLTAPPLNP